MLKGFWSSYRNFVFPSSVPWSLVFAKIGTRIQGKSSLPSAKNPSLKPIRVRLRWQPRDDMSCFSTLLVLLIASLFVVLFLSSCVNMPEGVITIQVMFCLLWCLLTFSWIAGTQHLQDTPEIYLQSFDSQLVFSCGAKTERNRVISKISLRSFILGYSQNWTTIT